MCLLISEWYGNDVTLFCQRPQAGWGLQVGPRPAAELGSLAVCGKEAVGAQSSLLVCPISFELVMFVPAANRGL